MEKKYISILCFVLVVVSFLGYGLVWNKNNKSEKKGLGDDVIIEPSEKNDPSLLVWKEIAVLAPWQGRDSQATVVFKNKIFLMGGVDATKRVISPGNIDYGNALHFKDVWVSENGIDWKQIAKNALWGERRSMQVVEFKGKLWLMGGWGPEIGYKNDIWSSEDGINWKIENKKSEWPAREGHQLLVFNNKMWLIGGVRYDRQKLFSDVWSSSDGKNWVEETKNAGWSSRWDHMSVVFDNKIWTIGGMNFTDNLLKDIWSSKDGKSWILENNNVPFLPRQGFALFNYKNMLWVVGRLNVPLYNNGPNDVWYSEDGIHWEKTKTDPGWTGREDVGAVIFKDKMWILGGMDKNWKWTNDIWVSEFQK